MKKKQYWLCFIEQRSAYMKLPLVDFRDLKMQENILSTATGDILYVSLVFDLHLHIRTPRVLSHQVVN